jgi:hypothetical protein
MDTEGDIEAIQNWELSQLPVMTTNYDDMIARVTARCAGFLEVHIHRGDLGRSLVQYFHRTARDFLETEVVWSKLLLQTAGTDFDPNVAMMKSCLMSLEMGILKELTRDFLVYAHHVDINLKNHTIQYVLVNKFDELRYSLSQVSDDFTNHWMSPLAPEAMTLLELTTLYGLWGYVENNLSQTPVALRGTEATKLLHHLLQPDDIYVKYGVPLPSLEMVSLLLDFGASLHDENLGLGVFENTLKYAVKAKTCAYSDSLLQRYILIMRVLILNGADPYAQVPGAPEDALGVVNKFLVPAYPEEAVKLLDEIHQARAAIQAKRATEGQPQKVTKMQFNMEKVSLRSGKSGTVDVTKEGIIHSGTTRTRAFRWLRQFKKF